MDNFINNFNGFVSVYRLEILAALSITVIFSAYALFKNRKYLSLIKEKILYRGDHRAETLYGDVANNMTLSGKPDYIVERDGEYIPLEYKSTMPPKHLYNRKFQMAGYFAIIEDRFEKKPSYGEFIFKDFTRARLNNTVRLKKALMRRVNAMYEILDNPSKLKRNHNSYQRCNVCRFNLNCDKRVFQSSFSS